MIYYLIAEKTNSSKKTLEFYFENSLSFAGLAETTDSADKYPQTTQFYLLFKYSLRLEQRNKSVVSNFSGNLVDSVVPYGFIY